MVTSYGPGSTGNYLLHTSLRNQSCTIGTCCLQGTNILDAPGESFVSSDLDPEDPLGGPRGDGYYYEDWEFFGEAGSWLYAEILGADFDSYFYLLDEGCNIIASDDDGGSGLMSRLDLYLPYTGVYTLVVTSFSSYEYGYYDMDVYVDY